MAITATTLRLASRIRAELAGVTDQQVRDLVAAWVTAWNEVSGDLNATLVDMLIADEHVSRAMLLRSERLRQALLIIRAALDDLAEQASIRILGDLDRVVDIAGGAQASVIDSQLPSTGHHLVDLERWAKTDPKALEAIVKRASGQITSRFRPLSAAADRALRAELIRGYAAGSNPRATAGRIVARAEGKFNGGLTRALAIARTETLDAARAGAHLGRLQNADVLQGWAWHCELSTRSCTACISMDGQVFPLDTPGPDDHVNGRCTAVPITKSWTDLGFGIEEPPSIRQSGADWFDGLDAGTQKQILGPGRYDAWKGGRYPMSDWSKFQHNDGWRNSLQTTPVPAAQSGGRAAS